MGEKKILIACTVFLMIMLHNFRSVASSRVLNVHPPDIPRELLRSPPQPPSLGWYSKNDDKADEGDAFRPTTHGHSPGVGHETPPH